MSINRASEQELDKKEIREIWLALRKTSVCFPRLDLEKFFIMVMSTGIIPERNWVDYRGWVDYMIRERIIYEYTILYNPSFAEENFAEITKLREVKKKWGTGDIEEAIIHILQTNRDLQSLLQNQYKRSYEEEK